MQSQTTTLCERCHSELIVGEKPNLPFSDDYFRSMYFPSASEISDISSTIMDCQHDLDRYDQEIKRLSKTLANLKERRRNLQAHTDRCRSFCSSVRKIPVEVLTEIFLWCCTPSSLCILEETIENALPLSQTCSFWRNVALSTPELWSSMTIDLSLCSEQHAGLVDFYLSRSEGGRGLTLDIEATVDDNISRNHSSYGGVITSLFHAHTRWRRVSFRLPWRLYDTLHYCVTDYWPSDFDNLRYLSLKWSRYTLPETLSPNTFPAFFWDDFADMPVFENLELSAFHPDFAFLYSSLKQLKIECIGRTSDLHSLFSACSSLEVLSFTMSKIDHDHSSRISSHRLRSLNIAFNDREIAARTLSQFTFPFLTNLSLKGPAYDSPVTSSVEMLASTKDMIRRCAHHLQVLELTSILETVQEATEVLDLTPALDCLIIDTCWVYRKSPTRSILQQLVLDPPRALRLSDPSQMGIQFDAQSIMRIYYH
ncbi:hypothetical protein VKT23_011113 [Stygiomarasmius scandens]|uniref:F-box domain-containing protein n=1 Tax=Marasmiellus scandens TaxID=2682957 RepID=A0ABR1JCJ2_9AGAR